MFFSTLFQLTHKKIRVAKGRFSLSSCWSGTKGTLVPIIGAVCERDSLRLGFRPLCSRRRIDVGVGGTSPLRPRKLFKGSYSQSQTKIIYFQNLQTSGLLKCLSFFPSRIPGIGMEKLHSFSQKLYGPIESRPCQAAITAMSSADGCLLCSKTWWSLESGSISNPKREISVIRVQKTMGVSLLCLEFTIESWRDWTMFDICAYIHIDMLFSEYSIGDIMYHSMSKQHNTNWQFQLEYTTSNFGLNWLKLATIHVKPSALSWQLNLIRLTKYFQNMQMN